MIAKFAQVFLPLQPSLQRLFPLLVPLQPSLQFCSQHCSHYVQHSVLLLVVQILVPSPYSYRVSCSHHFSSFSPQCYSCTCPNTAPTAAITLPAFSASPTTSLPHEVHSCVLLPSLCYFATG